MRIIEQTDVAETETELAGIGHNNPPAEYELTQTDFDKVEAKLRGQNKPLFDRAAELLKAKERLPAELADDEAESKVTSFAAQVKKCGTALEKARKDSKAPVLNLGRDIDTVFNSVTAQLAAIETACKVLIGVRFQQKEKARQEAEAERVRLAKIEADRLAGEAADLALVGDPEAEQRLEQAAAANDQAETTTTFSPVVSRGADGGTAGVRTVWKGEIKDILTIDLAVLRPYFSPDDVQKALNKFVASGGRVLKGATIAEVSSVVIRG